MERASLLDVLGNLSGTEAKLLLHRLATSGEETTNAEIMRILHIRDRKTYFAAKRKLAALEWLDYPTWTGREIQPGGREIQPMPNAQVGLSNLSTVDTGREIQPMPNAQVGKSNLSATGTGREIQPPVPPDWNARFAELDRLPGVDAIDRTHDRSFLARRQAQVEALQEAWVAFFGAELTVSNARRFLSLVGDYAEDLLEPMEYVQGRIQSGNFDLSRGSPVTYIKTMLERRKAEARQTPSGQPRSSFPAHEPESDNYFLSKPSPRTAMVLERLKKAGKLVPEEDD